MAIAKASFGKGFSTVINYVMIQKKVPLDLQPIMIECNGLIESNASSMAKQMLQISRDHNTINPVMHLPISFNADENITDEQAKKAIDSILADIGVDRAKHQFIIVEHRDKPNTRHFHCVVNRVDTDAKLLSNSKLVYKLQVACDKVEKVQGLQQTPNRTIIYDPTNENGYSYLPKEKKDELAIKKIQSGKLTPITDDKRPNRKLAIEEIQAKVAEVQKSNTKSPEEFKQKLAEKGIEVKYSYDQKNDNAIRGASFKTDKIKVRGGQIGMNWQVINANLEYNKATSLEVTVPSKTAQTSLKAEQEANLGQKPIVEAKKPYIPPFTLNDLNFVDYGIDPTKLSTEDVKSILGGYYTSVMQLPHPDNKDFKINARLRATKVRYKWMLAPIYKVEEAVVLHDYIKNVKLTDADKASLYDGLGLIRTFDRNLTPEQIAANIKPTYDAVIYIDKELNQLLSLRVPMAMKLMHGEKLTKNQIEDLAQGKALAGPKQPTLTNVSPVKEKQTVEEKAIEKAIGKDIITNANEVLETAKTPEEFKEKLAEKGITIEYQIHAKGINGASFTKNDVRFKGSDIGLKGKDIEEILAINLERIKQQSIDKALAQQKHDDYIANLAKEAKAEAKIFKREPYILTEKDKELDKSIDFVNDLVEETLKNYINKLAEEKNIGNKFLDELAKIKGFYKQYNNDIVIGLGDEYKVMIPARTFNLIEAKIAENRQIYGNNVGPYLALMNKKPELISRFFDSSATKDKKNSYNNALKERQEKALKPMFTPLTQEQFVYFVQELKMEKLSITHKKAHEKQQDLKEKAFNYELEKANKEKSEILANNKNTKFIQAEIDIDEDEIQRKKNYMPKI